MLKQFVWSLVLFGLVTPWGAVFANEPKSDGPTNEGIDQPLYFHLMHPGEDSLPGDPNAAFYLDGTYHLHYILRHPWQGRQSFSFVHVTSPDLLHWTWQTTKLQPSFTGHGMFSGTGFLTKDNRPAVIYHGESSGRNQIAIAEDRQLSAWQKPYPVDVRDKEGLPANINHWDPDCFASAILITRFPVDRIHRSSSPTTCRLGPWSGTLWPTSYQT